MVNFSLCGAVFSEAKAKQMIAQVRAVIPETAVPHLDRTWLPVAAVELLGLKIDPAAIPLLNAAKETPCKPQSANVSPNTHTVEGAAHVPPPVNRHINTALLQPSDRMKLFGDNSSPSSAPSHQAGGGVRCDAAIAAARVQVMLAKKTPLFLYDSEMRVQGRAKLVAPPAGASPYVISRMTLSQKNLLTDAPEQQAWRSRRPWPSSRAVKPSPSVKATQSPGKLGKQMLNVKPQDLVPPPPDSQSQGVHQNDGDWISDPSFVPSTSSDAPYFWQSQVAIPGRLTCYEAVTHVPRTIFGEKLDDASTYAARRIALGPCKVRVPEGAAESFVSVVVPRYASLLWISPEQATKLLGLQLSVEMVAQAQEAGHFIRAPECSFGHRSGFLYNADLVFGGEPAVVEAVEKLFGRSPFAATVYDTVFPNRSQQRAPEFPSESPRDSARITHLPKVQPRQPPSWDNPRGGMSVNADGKRVDPVVAATISFAGDSSQEAKKKEAAAQVKAQEAAQLEKLREEQAELKKQHADQSAKPRVVGSLPSTQVVPELREAIARRKKIQRIASVAAGTSTTSATSPATNGANLNVQFQQQQQPKQLAGTAAGQKAAVDATLRETYFSAESLQLHGIEVKSGEWPLMLHRSQYYAGSQLADRDLAVACLQPHSEFLSHRSFRSNQAALAMGKWIVANRAVAVAKDGSVSSKWIDENALIRAGLAPPPPASTDQPRQNPTGGGVCVDTAPALRVYDQASVLPPMIHRGIVGEGEPEEDANRLPPALNAEELEKWILWEVEMSTGPRPAATNGAVPSHVPIGRTRRQLEDLLLIPRSVTTYRNLATLSPEYRAALGHIDQYEPKILSTIPSMCYNKETGFVGPVRPGRPKSMPKKRSTCTAQLLALDAKCVAFRRGFIAEEQSPIWVDVRDVFALCPSENRRLTPEWLEENAARWIPEQPIFLQSDKMEKSKPVYVVNLGDILDTKRVLNALRTFRSSVPVGQTTTARAAGAAASTSSPPHLSAATLATTAVSEPAADLEVDDVDAEGVIGGANDAIGVL